jgi:hypothetical protein
MQKDDEQETLDEQFRFSYASAEADSSEIIERRYGRIITRGQTNPAANHEEGSRDQDSETKESETDLVGHPQNDRKETRRPSGTYSTTQRRSAWFLDETREIQADSGWAS